MTNTTDKYASAKNCNVQSKAFVVTKTRSWLWGNDSSTFNDRWVWNEAKISDPDKHLCELGTVQWLSLLTNQRNNCRWWQRWLYATGLKWFLDCLTLVTCRL